jgi:uncharacterized protein YndB with AHSA1/START domain
MNNETTFTPVCREFIIDRTFNAPRDLVWKALTEPDRMKEWFSPKGFTARVAKHDFRPGGIYHYCLTSADGHEMWGKVAYREIDAPTRLVYINSFSDAQGNNTRHPMSANWPLELLTTFILAEADGKTTLTITWLPHHATEQEIQAFDHAREGMKQGWTGTLDNLTDYLAKQ